MSDLSEVSICASNTPSHQDAVTHVSKNESNLEKLKRYSADDNLTKSMWQAGRLDDSKNMKTWMENIGADRMGRSGALDQNGWEATGKAGQKINE